MGPKNEFGTGMVNKPLVFESLKLNCSSQFMLTKDLVWAKP